MKSIRSAFSVFLGCGFIVAGSFAAAINAQESADALHGPVWEKISPLLDQSVDALSAGDSARAEALRQEALALSGFQGSDSISPVDTLAAHAERALRAGFSDAAIADFREASQGSRRTDHTVILAKLLIAKGEFAEAIARLTEVPRAAAEYGAAQLLVGTAHLTLYAKNPSVEQLADATLALNPPTRTTKTALTPEWTAALNELDGCLKKLSPEERTILADARKTHRLARAKVLLDDHSRDEALPLLNELLAEDPFCPEAYELRIRVSDYEKARNAADAKVAAELRAPAPQIPASGDADAVALTEADARVHQRPFDAQAYVRRVITRITLDHPTSEQADAANADATLATALDPFDPETFQALTETLIAQEKFVRVTDAASIEEKERLQKAAIWAADNALALAPKQVGLLIWRAQKQHQAGDGTNAQNAARALMFLNQAIAVAPTSRLALYARAEAATKAEEYPQAAEDYQALVRLAPTEPVYSYNLGWVLMEMDKFHAAAAAFATSIAGQNVPDDARSLQALMLAFADDPKAEELAESIPEHSVSSGGVSTAHWNISHNKGRNSPLIERVNQRLSVAKR